MGDIQNTLIINVEHSTEDEEYGPIYVAACDEIGLVTDGRTFEELLANLREALAACLEDTDTVAEFNLSPHPRVLITMQLWKPHAQTA